MNLFIVTSTIYTPYRTHFSMEQRLEQTLKTSESIDRYCPGSYKLLVDGSSNLTHLQIDLLRSKYDMVITVNDSEVNNHWNISFGEIALLKIGLQYTRRLNIPIDRIFKLSGRYELSAEFSLNFYEEKDKYHFYRDILHNDTGYDPLRGRIYKTSDFIRVDMNYYLTVLYMIPFTRIDEFLQVLDIPLVSDVEHLLYNSIDPVNVKILEVNGFEGRLGSSGDYIKR